MTITKQDFEAFPTRTYDEARTDIRNGDIALFSGDEGMSKLIEHFTGSPFSHVGFVWRMDDIDRILLLESVEVAGVRMLPLSSKINGGLSGRPYNGTLLIARHDEFPQPGPTYNEAFGRMTRVAVDRLGCPYNADEIAMIAVNMAAGLAGIELPDTMKPSNAFICSEYADACYRELGIEVGRKVHHFVAPADFANDPKVRPIVRIGPG